MDNNAQKEKREDVGPVQAAIFIYLEHRPSGQSTEFV